MKQVIEIKGENDEIKIVSLKNEITNEELNLIDGVFNAINDFKPYTTENGWQHYRNFPTQRCLRSDKNEKSIEDLYIGVCTKEQLEMFYKFCPYDINNITDIDILYVGE